MIGAEILIECLKNEGVKHIFGYPGGVVLPLYDKLNKQKDIRHILVRHEQAAALAADGYARASGKTGVCLATSGPGATNLVTGIANAYLDSIPIVAITGQVITNYIGTDAFQEVDITGICMPITKQTYQIQDAKDIPRVIAEAFHIASNGRPGPVLIDLPKNVQEQEIKKWSFVKEVDLPGYKPIREGNQIQVDNAIKLIESSKKPVVLCGHGVVLGNAEVEFKKFAEKLGAPVLSTLLAMDILPKSHRLNFGMLGMHGQLAANYAVHHSDLIIGIGLRFDDRILGNPKDFASNAKVIHIDIDRAEIGKNRVVDIPIVGDAKLIIPAISKDLKPKNHTDWLNQVQKWDEEKTAKLQKTTICKGDICPSGKMSAKAVVKMISKVTKGNAIVAADVGQNQMWTANYYEFASPRNHLSSGGLGDMGYSIPAAMGAKIAREKDTVIAICGDGGFQMNSQELMTLIQDKIDVKIVILNNGFLGMVRQWQELFYKKNYSYTTLLSPDFVKLAESYGLKAWKAENIKDAEKYLTEALNHKGPTLINMIVESEENVFPMVSPGASLKDTRIS